MRKAKDAVDLLGEEQPTLTRSSQALQVALEDLGLAIGEATIPTVNFFTRAITGAVKGVTGLVNATKINNKEIIDNIDAYKGLNPEIDAAIKLYHEYVASSGPATGKTREQANAVSALIIQHQEEQKAILAKAVADEKARMAKEKENEQIFKEAETKSQLTKITYDNITALEKQDEFVEKNAQTMGTFNDRQALTIMGVERFGATLAQAAIHGNNMGDAVVASLKSIAAELVSKAATFAIMNMFTGGAVGAFTGAMPGANAGGFGGFLLRGFTGQTPSVNVNISGGLVSQSYVKNTLVPALNNARALG